MWLLLIVGQIVLGQSRLLVCNGAFFSALAYIVLEEGLRSSCHMRLGISDGISDGTKLGTSLKVSDGILDGLSGGAERGLYDGTSNGTNLGMSLVILGGTKLGVSD